MLTGSIDWSNPIARGGLNKGLVGWWLARGPGVGGNVLYDLTGRAHGTLTNTTAPSWAPSNRHGGSMAITLDGTDDSIVCPASRMPLVTNYTIAAWVRADGSGGADRGRIYQRNDGATAGVLFGIAADATSPYTLGVIHGASAFQSNTTGITINVWTHVAVTFDGATVQHYSNGLPNGTVSFATAVNDAAAIVPGIGYSPVTASRNWNGRIEEVRVHDRAMPASEVYQLYKDSLTGYQQTLRKLPSILRTFGGATFKPAWARGCNQYIGAGAA